MHIRRRAIRGRSSQGQVWIAKQSSTLPDINESHPYGVRDLLVIVSLRLLNVSPVFHRCACGYHDSGVFLASLGVSMFEVVAR